jgi:hypothetical protein
MPCDQAVTHMQSESRTLFALEDEHAGRDKLGESSRSRTLSASSAGRHHLANMEHEEDTQALLGSSRRASVTSKAAGDDEVLQAQGEASGAVRVASKEQKAALWWRNFFITGIFVVLW